MNIKDTYTLNNNIEIPKLGYGTFQTPDDETGVQAIVDAINIGYRHIDTAQGYNNEESVGKAVKVAGIPRDELFITTKVTNSVRGFEQTIKSIDESLSKLDMDYIDLVLIHWPNPKPFRDQWQLMNSETWRALEAYYNQGKIKAIGVSNFKSHHIIELLKNATIKPSVNQIRLCPGDVDFETVNICKEHDMILEAYSPLGQGLVFEVEELKELTSKYKKSIAQICLRWSLQMGFVPLPKSVTYERIEANTKIYDFELDNKDVELMTNLIGRCGSSKDPDQLPW